MHSQSRVIFSLNLLYRASTPGCLHPFGSAESGSPSASEPPNLAESSASSSQNDDLVNWPGCCLSYHIYPPDVGTNH